MTMAFAYSRRGLEAKTWRLERWLEILPGALSWGVLLTVVILSIIAPLIAAALVIAFYLYWLLRVFYMTVFLCLSSARLAIERRTDWMERCRGVEDPPAYAARLRAHVPRGGLGVRLSHWLHRRDVDALFASGDRPPRWPRFITS